MKFPERTFFTAKDLEPILRMVRPFTMVANESLVDLANQMLVVLRDNIPGAFVECGVWRGGASFLMAELLRQFGVTDRKVWLFDSFEGIPLPQEIDGPAAKEWAKTPNKPWYADKTAISVDAVRATAEKFGLAEYTKFVKGWFDQTLAATRERLGPIAILRIDCDWYASVRCCLENLYDNVADGGFVIIDDYYTYDGSVLAVHEFLAKRGLAHRIESVSGKWGGSDYYFCARFRKGPTNWKWAHTRDVAAREIVALVPAGETLILVDDQQFGNQIAPDRQVLSFLEKDGVYWGTPADSATAIRELEQMRGAGARLIIFLWPGFWWLDHYAEFHDYLRSKYRRIIANERVVGFELRGALPG